jgi:hypothetical protein
MRPPKARVREQTLKLLTYALQPKTNRIRYWQWVGLHVLPTHNSLNNSSNSLHLTESESSLPCSERPTNWPYPDQSESNTKLHNVFNFHCNITLPNTRTHLSTQVFNPQFFTPKMSQVSHCKGCRYWTIYFAIFFTVSPSILIHYI